MSGTSAASRDWRWKTGWPDPCREPGADLRGSHPFDIVRSWPFRVSSRALDRLADETQRLRHVVRPVIGPPGQRAVDQRRPARAERLAGPGRGHRFGDDFTALEGVERAAHRQ